MPDVERSLWLFQFFTWKWIDDGASNPKKACHCAIKPSNRVGVGPVGSEGEVKGENLMDLRWSMYPGYPKILIQWSKDLMFFFAWNNYCFFLICFTTFLKSRILNFTKIQERGTKSGYVFAGLARPWLCQHWWKCTEGFGNWTQLWWKSLGVGVGPPLVPWKCMPLAVCCPFKRVRMSYIMFPQCHSNSPSQAAILSFLASCASQCARCREECSESMRWPQIQQLMLDRLEEKPRPWRMFLIHVQQTNK